MPIIENLCRLFKKKIFLTVIFVEYERHDGSSDKVFEILQGYLAAIQNCRITYLRVDNKSEEEIKRDGNVYTMGGDNTWREFSGWQKGVEAIKLLKLNCDLVLIVNDMFLKPGPSFLQDYSNREILKRSMEGNKIIGRIDTVNQQYRVFGYDVSSWVCTNAFFAPRKALEQLKSVVLIDDNIHDILVRDYSDKHLQSRVCLTPADLEDGTFSIKIDLRDNYAREMRFKLDLVSAEGEIITTDNMPLGIIPRAVTYNGNICSEEVFIRGIDDSLGRTAQSFLLSLPREPGRFVFKGLVPAEIRAELCPDLLRISIYNDSYLYQKNAPINIDYQRWLVEWLTERWHSRFALNAATWELFKTKSAAIINESLLTAKFLESGYKAENFGDNTYY
ncbi:MAG TPA: hypothetical protein ENK33_11510 [Desulfobacterales bacterium]|nr:hypothetical protein [Desulfobacterales bacterium]